MYIKYNFPHAEIKKFCIKENESNVRKPPNHLETC